MNLNLKFACLQHSSQRRVAQLATIVLKGAGGVSETDLSRFIHLDGIPPAPIRLALATVLQTSAAELFPSMATEVFKTVDAARTYITKNLGAVLDALQTMALSPDTTDAERAAFAALVVKLSRPATPASTTVSKAAAGPALAAIDAEARRTDLSDRARDELAEARVKVEHASGVGAVAVKRKG